MRVYGSNNLQNNSGILNPSWECFVDGVSIAATPFQSPENNWQFCGSPVLADGNHVLTVNASVSSPQTFWIDQIQYLPLAGSQPQLANATVLVDNLDPMLKPAFGKGWGELGGSANMTTTSGSQFTLNFTGELYFTTSGQSRSIVSFHSVVFLVARRHLPQLVRLHPKGAPYRGHNWCIFHRRWLILELSSQGPL